MACCRILEVKLLSAEDLVEISKNMKTYAIVWVQQDQKLTTGVDQTGRTNPSWNDEFAFQVDDKFLNSEDAKIVVEIYAAAWVKDALVGSVNVNISDIFLLRSVTDANNSAAKTVTLQIRRPSGRPQGILNMEVALVDSTKRSLPLSEEEPKPKSTNVINTENHDNDTEAKMIRSQSDESELKKEENAAKGTEKGSIINGCLDSSESEEVKGSDSIVNGGSMVNGDSVCSTDVGPSASVVAAAIAKGLYKPPVNNQVQAKENPKIKEWTRKEREQEEIEMKIERWGSEIPPPGSQNHGKGRKGKGKNGGRTKLFSCFSNAFGIEISITCGANDSKQGVGNGSNNNKVHHLGSVDDNYSHSNV